MFRAAGRSNRWESPWWRCIWSFRIHATLSVLSDGSKGKGARLPILGLSHPCVAAAVPRERVWLGLHLCWLLIGAICAEFYHSFLFPQGTQSRFSWQSADVMTTATNKRQALQWGDKRFTESTTKQVLASAAELSPFNICLIDCILTGIPPSGKLEGGHSLASQPE